MKYAGTLKVEPKLLAKLNAWCQKQDPDTGKEVVFDEEVYFENGWRMAIQVVGCQDEPAWTQGVVFDPDGNERGCTDVGDQLDGEYIVDVYPRREHEPEDTYVVIVEAL